MTRLSNQQGFLYTNKDDRYESYALAVTAADRVSYIKMLYLELDEELMAGFNLLGVTWKEKRIEDYQVFMGLSRLARPEEAEVSRMEGK